jgi:hypothetical protein
VRLLLPLTVTASFSVTSGSVPGLTLESTQPRLVGTPTTVGAFPITLHLEGTECEAADLTTDITVAAPECELASACRLIWSAACNTSSNCTNGDHCVLKAMGDNVCVAEDQSFNCGTNTALQTISSVENVFFSSCGIDAAYSCVDHFCTRG